MPSNSIRRWFFIIFLLITFSGCSGLNVNEEKSAQELVHEGMEAFQDGSYRDALKAFQTLKDWYPFSKYAVLAELKIPDSHYELGEYDEAIFAYKDFENLHPLNEAIPYVIYRIGNCHFKQMDTSDRDHTSAEKALAAFQRLKAQYPGDSYAIRAEAKIKECLKLIADHDFRVGLFYYKSKRYKAALYRFKSIITQYPDVGIHQKALAYITLCEEKLAN